jgi:hypothetical protein
MAPTVYRLAPTLPCCPVGSVVGYNHPKVSTNPAGVGTLFFVVGNVIFILSSNFLPVNSILNLIFVFFSMSRTKMTMA